MHCFVVSVSLTYALFAPAGQVADGEKDAFYFNRLLGRGINMGNALEAPREGEWGVTLRDEYFQRIKEAGFHSVRIPIRWSAHAKPAVPFTIDDALLQGVQDQRGPPGGRPRPAPPVMEGCARPSRE